MKEIDKPDFRKILDGLASVYDKEVNEEKSELYFNALKDFDLKTLRMACKEVVKNPDIDWFPKIADIYKEASFIQREVRTSKKKAIYCTKCKGTGWIAVEKSDGYEPAYRCACLNGQRMSKESMSYEEAMKKYSLFPLNEPEETYGIVTTEDIIADPGKIYNGVTVERLCKNCGKKYFVTYHDKVTGRWIMECYMGTENFQNLIDSGDAEHIGGHGLCEICEMEEGRRRGLWE